MADRKPVPRFDKVCVICGDQFEGFERSFACSKSCAAYVNNYARDMRLKGEECSRPDAIAGGRQRYLARIKRIADAQNQIKAEASEVSKSIKEPEKLRWIQVSSSSGYWTK